jgi:hypothetical protein
MGNFRLCVIYFFKKKLGQMTLNKEKIKARVHEPDLLGPRVSPFLMGHAFGLAYQA